MAGQSPRRGLFTPARRTRSFEDIVEQIRSATLDGTLEAGDRLPNERELCGAFGVSRSTLREGLRTLEALGVVEIRTGSAGGIFVVAPDETQVGYALEALIRFRSATAQELDEFRTSFEAETAYWAAQRAGDEELAALDAIVRAYGEGAEQAGLHWEHLVQLDIDFHEAIARASGNQIRVAIMLAIHRALQRASSSIGPYASQALRRQIGVELGGIADAVKAHNARLARTRMRRHVARFSGLERSIEAVRGDGAA
jgi:DNA-binding FadR family transcriptional regulator